MSAKNEHQTFPYGDVAAECTEAGQLSSPRDATASEADTTPLSAASVNDDDDDYLAAWMREDGKPARYFIHFKPVSVPHLYSSYILRYHKQSLYNAYIFILFHFTWKLLSHLK